MTTYIITYDLSAPGRNYDELYKRIRGYKDYAHITESSWAVKTDGTAVDVRDNLAGAMDSNDKLFVCALTTPAAWRGLDKEITDWLKRPF